MTVADRMDMLKTQLQTTGKCIAHALSVAEMVGVYGGLGASYLAVVKPYVPKS